MKKTTFFILIAVFGTVTALYSQTDRLVRHDSKNISFGIKAGISIATLGGDVEYTEVKIGSTIGLFGTIKLGYNIGISADALYSQQGCNFDTTKITDADYKLNYLNIPLLINWYVPWAPGLTVKGGLQTGFLLSSKAKTDGISVDASNIFNSTDFSIPLGISYEFALGLLLDVRYHVGVANIYNSDKSESDVTDISMKNSVFQVTFGYRF